MWLTNSKVCVYGGIACRASQVLVLPVGDVLVCAGIAVLFGQAKVNDVHQVTLLAKPHKEVVRLNISMDEILRVDVLNATDLMKIQDKQTLSGCARGRRRYFRSHYIPCMLSSQNFPCVVLVTMEHSVQQRQKPIYMKAGHENVMTPDYN